MPDGGSPYVNGNQTPSGASPTKSRVMRFGLISQLDKKSKSLTTKQIYLRIRLQTHKQKQITYENCTQENIRKLYIKNKNSNNIESLYKKVVYQYLNKLSMQILNNFSVIRVTTPVTGLANDNIKIDRRFQEIPIKYQPSYTVTKQRRLLK